ncbi:MAG: hypothetical protein WC464_07805 [Bdellovibrionales bacterium]
MMAVRANTGRMSPNAGIAIGPILFIIAILAILASAIAAGSGSFTAGTGTESNKTKSSALVQIGENLKMGMDQITMEVGISIDAVDINVANTSLNNQLFSPIGGGVAPPSVGMANNPVMDKWAFPRGPVGGLGTGGDNVVAVLAVSRGVCAEVNNRSMGISAVPPAKNLGTFVSGTGGITATNWPDTTDAANWTSGGTTTTITGPTLEGVSTGCVYNTGATGGAGCTYTDGVGASCTAGPTTQFFFYQVMAIQ